MNENYECEEDFNEFDYEDYENYEDYDWGYNEDEGFDPYMGEYTYDC